MLLCERMLVYVLLALAGRVFPDHNDGMEVETDH